MSVNLMNGKINLSLGFGNFISNGLPKVDEVARAIIEYCKIEGRLLNGQNIKLDSGLSNLYPDQVDKQNYA